VAGIKSRKPLRELSAFRTDAMFECAFKPSAALAVGQPRSAFTALPEIWRTRDARLVDYLLDILRPVEIIHGGKERQQHSRSPILFNSQCLAAGNEGPDDLLLSVLAHIHKVIKKGDVHGDGLGRVGFRPRESVVVKRGL